MKRRITIITVATLGPLLLAYVIAYIASTRVVPKGHGGLSGPLKVRMFQSEQHLVGFYPLYLVERWVRNRSFTMASCRFNVDFENHVYEHDYLYGDGKYGTIWYDKN